MTLHAIESYEVETVFDEVLDRLKEELAEYKDAGEQVNATYVEARIILYTDVLSALLGKDEA